MVLNIKTHIKNNIWVWIRKILESNKNLTKDLMHVEQQTFYRITILT